MVNAHLGDRQKLLDLTGLDRLDLQLDLLSMIFGGGRLKLEVEGQHRSGLSSGRSGLFVGGLGLCSEGIEFADHQ